MHVHAHAHAHAHAPAPAHAHAHAHAHARARALARARTRARARARARACACTHARAREPARTKTHKKTQKHTKHIHTHTPTLIQLRDASEFCVRITKEMRDQVMKYLSRSVESPDRDRARADKQILKKTFRKTEKSPPRPFVLSYFSIQRAAFFVVCVGVWNSLPAQ